MARHIPTTEPVCPCNVIWDIGPREALFNRVSEELDLGNHDPLSA